MKNTTNRLLREDGKVRRQEFERRPMELWKVEAYSSPTHNCRPRDIMVPEYYTNESDALARKEQLLTHRAIFEEWHYGPREKTWGEDRNTHVVVWKVETYNRLPMGGERR